MRIWGWLSARGRRWAGQIGGQKKGWAWLRRSTRIAAADRSRLFIPHHLTVQAPCPPHRSASAVVETVALAVAAVALGSGSLLSWAPHLAVKLGDDSICPASRAAHPTMQVLLGSRAPLLLAPVASRPATQRTCATSRAAAAGTALAPRPPTPQQLGAAWLVRRPRRAGLLHASRRTPTAQCAAFGSTGSSSSSNSGVPDQASSSGSDAGPNPSAAAAEASAGHRWLQRTTVGAALCAAAFLLSARSASAHRSDARMPLPPAAVAEAAEVSPAYQAAAAAQQQQQRGWRDTGILLAARGDDQQEGSGKVRAHAACRCRWQLQRQPLLASLQCRCAHSAACLSIQPPHPSSPSANPFGQLQCTK
jgi:hypothetical protein